MSTRLDWSDPSFIVALLTLVVTAAIPWLIWRRGVKQSEQDSALLASQKQMLARQRRDTLLTTLDDASSDRHLQLLWREVEEFEGEDRDLLRSAFRANPSIALPGGANSIEAADSLDQKALDDYTAGLERRYSVAGIYPSYTGLLDFLRRVVTNTGLKTDLSIIVDLVTGPTAQSQKPGHQFYRDLVEVLPESAASLLYKVEEIDYRTSGGLRLNVLTGVLLGLKDAELGRGMGRGQPNSLQVSVFREQVPTSLAFLLHRDNLRWFNQWSTDGSTEPVSATVAWLIRAVGWFADTDDHLAKRMVENLLYAIDSIPVGDRRWGIIDAEDVRYGFSSIQRKQPQLWDDYGPDLERAADTVGSWRAKELGTA
ncbi:hypothetical protein ACN082_03175 [Rothia sp. CCM 9417]|uniref:hypothetical protein n=1 Tax=Rothia sp. CCM 9417 TaxID=3402657 RepID=UPI003AD8E9EB